MAAVHDTPEGVVAAAIPAKFGLACKNHLSAGGPKYVVSTRETLGSRGQMWGVVYDWPKVVRHNKDWATFPYWKSWGPKLVFHHVENETGRGGVCFANIPFGRGGVFAVGFSMLRHAG